MDDLAALADRLKAAVHEARCRWCVTHGPFGRSFGDALDDAIDATLRDYLKTQEKEG